MKSGFLFIKMEPDCIAKTMTKSDIKAKYSNPYSEFVLFI